MCEKMRRNSMNTARNAQRKKIQIDPFSRFFLVYLIFEENKRIF
jgi:hypothetical protein